MILIYSKVNFILVCKKCQLCPTTVKILECHNTSRSGGHINEVTDTITKQ